MNDFNIRIYTEDKELPELLEGNFFHSKELFLIEEQTPKDTPYMAVATRDGKVRGQLLVIVRMRMVKDAMRMRRRPKPSFHCC